MFKRNPPIDDLERHAALPVQRICIGAADQRVAVHIHGNLRGGRLPMLCLHGYARNMLDFAQLPQGLARTIASDTPLVLVDFPGRGRSFYQSGKTPYSTLIDAEAALSVLDALDVEKVIVLGQGHGGQAGMLMARRRPASIAAAILVDCGPVTDPRGLVRTRNNLRFLAGARSRKAATSALNKMLSADYPGESENRLEELALRQFWFDRRGRAQGLFDTRLVDQLEKFDFDDVLEPQWPLFDGLNHADLMLVRTQLSDQLRRETFDEMVRRRPDAATLTISGQGNPALLDGSEELDAIAGFISSVETERTTLAEIA